MKQLIITVLLSIPFLIQAQQTTDSTISKKPKCPVGQHTDHVVPIVYGKPTRETVLRSEKGELWLGGCIVSEQSPRNYCKLHKREF